MRRTAGVVVVVAGAVLGAGSGVLANDRLHGLPRPPGADRHDVAAVTGGDPSRAASPTALPTPR